MKRRILLYIGITLFSLRINAQNTIDLSSNDCFYTFCDKVARNKINFLPGYAYDPKNDGGALYAHINETVQLPVSYFSTPLKIANKPAVNFSKGGPQGSYVVDNLGNAAYTVPLNLPDGTAGMQPNLSIQYNSSGSDGQLGLGWYLSGISSIKKVQKDLYHDGTSAGYEYELDGQRLIAIGNAAIGTGLRYKTENDNLATIESQANNVDNQSFTVTFNDGTVMEYATTADSRIEWPGSPINRDIQYYLLSKVSDHLGNYMTFSYIKNYVKNTDNTDKFTGEYYISEINYTGNSITHLNTYNTLKFFYDIRTDNATTCEYGQVFSHNLLLRQIACYNNSIPLKRYNFDYILDEKSKLNKISEVDIAGNTLNDLWIEWEAHTNNKIETKNQLLPIQSNYVAETLTQLVDLDNDGKDEIYQVPYYSASQLTQTMEYASLSNRTQTFWSNSHFKSLLETWFIYDGNTNNQPGGNSGFIYDPVSNTTGKSTYYPKFNATDNYDPRFYQGDFNGDGIKDVFTLGYTTNLTVNPIEISHNISMDINLGGYAFLQKNITFKKNFFFTNATVGDFDGDGYDDILLSSTIKMVNNVTVGKSTTTFYIYYGSKDFCCTNPVEYNWPQVITDKIFVADLNNDKHSEVITPYNGKYHHISIHKDGTIGIISDDFLKDPNGSDYALPDLQFADFNGDGLTDVLIDYGIQYFLVKFNLGNYNFVLKPVPIASKYMYIIASDFTGDGKADVILIDLRLKKDNGSNLSNDVHFELLELQSNEITNSTGNANFASILSESIPNFDVLVPIYATNGGWGTTYAPFFRDNFWPAHFSVGDVDGDGSSDIVFKNFCTLYNDNFIAFFKAHNQTVNAISDAKNNVVNFTYKHVSEPGVLSVSSPKKTGPDGVFYSIKNANLVVQNVTLQNPCGKNQTISYAYSDLLRSVERATLSGFLTISSTDSYKNFKTKIESECSDFCTLRNKSSLLSTISDNIISKSTITNSTIVVDQAKKVYFPHTKVETTDNTGVTTTSETTISNLSPTSSYNVLTTESANGNLKSSLVNYTLNTVNNRNVYLPSTVQNTKTTTNSTYTTNQLITYSNGTLGKSITTTSSITEPSQAPISQSVTETLTTDNYFNTLTASSNLPSSVTYQYDNTGRYLIQDLDNITGYKNIYQYSTNGLLTNKTDRLNHTSTLSYDTEGKITKVNSWNGKNVQFIYTNGSGTNAYAIKRQGPLGMDATNYYDCDDQLVLSNDVGLTAGKTVSKTRSYNTRNQITSSLLNGFGESYTYYDNMRLQTKVTPRATSSYSYTGLNSVETNPFETHTLNYNANGMLGQSFYNDITTNEYVNYTNYNALGQPMNLVVKSGTTNLKHDAYGNVIEKTQQGMPTEKYGFDVFSRPTSLSYAASGGTYNANITYSSTTGLLDKITEPDDKFVTGARTTSYVYDAVHKDKPQSISLSSENTSFQFEYTSNGDVSKQTLLTDGIQLSTSYTYDSYSRPITQKSPSGDVLNFQYNAIGYLEKITNNSGTVIWQLIASDESGRITSVNLGTHLLSYNYNASTGTISGITSTGMADMQYSYTNADKDLPTSIIDNTRKLVQTLGWNDYKLNSWKSVVNGAIIDNATATFSINGNILAKSDISNNYAYSATMPYNVASLSPIVAGAPEETQEITYTPFKMVRTIKLNSNTATFTYAPGNDRSLMKIDYANGTWIKHYYFGDYEKLVYSTGKIIELNYVKVNGSIVGVLYKENGAATKVYHVVCDNLGTPVSIVDATAGSTPISLYTNPWGKPLSGQTSLPWFTRTYTGQEYLPDFGLINMNARLYDPMLGRFLSSDPLLTDILLTAGHNTHVYCLNNPVLFSDPTGMEKTCPNPPWCGQSHGPNSSNAPWSGYNYLQNSGFVDYTRASSSTNGAPAEAVALFDAYKANDPNTAKFNSRPAGSNYIAGGGKEKSQAGVGSTLNNVNTGIGVITGMFNVNYESTAKQTFKYAQRVNGEIITAAEISAQSTARALSISRSLLRINVATSVIGIGYSLNQAYSDYKLGGWKKVNGFDVADAGVGVGSLAVTGACAFGWFGVASNPIGWGVGIGTGLYFGGRLIYDFSK